MNHRVVQGHLNRLSTGDTHRDWLSWFIRSFPSSNRLHRVLVLGCGEGWLERALAANPWIERIDACDVAEGAVARAREQAHLQGLTNIHYDTVDLNSASLPADTYDIVIAHSVLHHVENLEGLFEQIERSMRPGAWIAINEFIGPPHLQYREEAMRAMNEVMAALPERFRLDVTTGEVLERKSRPDLDYMLATDPSEGVRADELDGFIRDCFDLAYEADLGGTMLQHLLWGLVCHFREREPIDELMLQWICDLERTMIENGALASDYRFYVGRKRGDEAPAAPNRMKDSRKCRAGDATVVRSDEWRLSPAAREHFHRVATGDPTCDWWTKVFSDLESAGHGVGARVLWMGDDSHWLLDVLEERFDSVVPFRWSLLAAQRRSFDLAIAPSGSPWKGTGARFRLLALGWLMRSEGVLVTTEAVPPDSRARALERRFGQPMIDAVGGRIEEDGQRGQPSRLTPALFVEGKAAELGGGLLEAVLDGTWSRIPEGAQNEVVSVLATAERLLIESGEALSRQQGWVFSGPRSWKLLLQLFRI